MCIKNKAKDQRSMETSSLFLAFQKWSKMTDNLIIK